MTSSFEWKCFLCRSYHLCPAALQSSTPWIIWHNIMLIPVILVTVVWASSLTCVKDVLLPRRLWKKKVTHFNCTYQSLRSDLEVCMQCTTGFADLSCWGDHSSLGSCQTFFTSDHIFLHKKVKVGKGSNVRIGSPSNSYSKQTGDRISPE